MVTGHKPELFGLSGRFPYPQLFYFFKLWSRVFCPYEIQSENDEFGF